MTEVQSPNQMGEEGQGLKLFHRVWNYPSVHTIVEASRAYYTTAKNSNTLLKYTAETMESNVEKSIHWIEPVVKNETVKKYTDPLLAKVDEIGCKQLDSLEKWNDTVSETYQNIRKIDLNATMTRVGALADYGRNAIEQSITPVDEYLKDSIIGAPLNVALDVTEQICDRILPPAQEKEGAEENKENEHPQGEKGTRHGPVFRASHLSRRVQRDAYAKIRGGLKLRSEESLKMMTYTVDLIKYATNNLDNSAKLANEFVAESVKKGQEKQKEVLEKVNQLKNEALKNLGTAVDALSSQLQTPLAATKHTLDTIKSKASGWHIQTDLDVSSFAEIAKTAVTKLQDVNHQLTGYISKNQVVPVPLLSTISGTVDSVLSSLLALADTNKAGTNKAEEAPQKQHNS